jgi:hypothetical protein
MPEDVIRVRATLRLLPTSEGGLPGPIRSGFRPNHNFLGHDSQVTAIGNIELLGGKELLYPGESADVLVTFIWWNGFGELYPGRQWRILQARKLVGIGTVIEVLQA